MKDGSDALKQGGPTFLKHELHVSSPETLTSKKAEPIYRLNEDLCPASWDCLCSLKR